MYNGLGHYRRTDVVPGMIAAIQTHGRLSQWNCHLHALISAGAFAKDGTFFPLPEKLDTAPFLKLWEKNIFDLLLAEGKITAGGRADSILALQWIFRG